MVKKLNIEVAFATVEKQICISLALEQSISIEEVIIQSGITQIFPEIDLSTIKIGIYGKVSKLEKLVDDGDRVEIYRALLINPMDARRNRAVKLS